jgi:kindlin 2
MQSMYVACDVMQLQIQRQAQQPQNDMNGSQGEDEVDAALDELQVSLEGSGISSSADITRVPKLEAELKFFKYVV